MLIGLLADELVPPQVTALCHGNVLLGALNNKHIAYIAAVLQRFVDCRLQQRLLCRDDNPPSAVITISTPQSTIREYRASDEKPPKTTVCGAPILAQASIATTASGIIGR